MHQSVLTYTQLQPQDVPSNRFAYHLERLVSDGFIKKIADGYTLTAAGRSLADRVSHETMSVRLQPHIVTTLSVANEAGEIALFKHSFQPYLGVVGYPQGRIHYGESVQQAAERELAEKTGLTGVSLIHRGMIYITGADEGVAISRILAHVFTGSVHGAPTLTCIDQTKGESFWGKIPEYVQAPYMPGFVEVTELLTRPKDSLFFAEIITKMPYSGAQ